MLIFQEIREEVEFVEVASANSNAESHLSSLETK